MISGAKGPFTPSAIQTRGVGANKRKEKRKNERREKTESSRFSWISPSSETPQHRRVG